MSDYTLTPNLGLYKPTYDADTEQWGYHLNDNATIIDSAFSPTGGHFLPLTGGTMSGVLTLAADPVGAMDAATRQYVLAQMAGGPFLPTAGGTMGGALMVTATGASASRSVQDRFAEVVDIHDYGQIGTGNAATDTATFLAAVAALPANGGLLKIGGVTGSITLNQTITITKSCKILGDTMNGWMSSIVCLMSGPAILFSDPTPSYQKTFAVENVRFVANNPTGPTQSAVQVNVGPIGSQAFPSFIGRNVTIAANVASAASPYAQTFTRGIEFVPASVGGAGIHNFWNAVLEDVMFLGAPDSGTGQPIAGTAGITFGRLICANFDFVHVSQAASGFHQTEYCEGIAARCCQLFSVGNGWDMASFSPEGAGQVKLLQPVMIGSMVNASQSSLALDCVMIGQFSNNYLTGAGAINVNFTNAQSTQVCNNYIISGTTGVSFTKGSYNEGSNIIALNVLQNQTTNIALGASTFDSVLDNLTGSGGAPVISNAGGTGNVIRYAGGPVTLSKGGLSVTVAASSATDVVNGINFGAGIGINQYGSSLNLTAPSGAAVAFYAGSSNIGYINASGLNACPVGGSGAAAGSFTSLSSSAGVNVTATATSATDVVHGISLGAGIGINQYGSSLNLTAASGSAVAFYTGAANTGYILPAGLALVGGLGVHGTAASATKPTVTGSKGANAALTSLMTALAAYGLVTDSTT